MIRALIILVTALFGLAEVQLSAQPPGRSGMRGAGQRGGPSRGRGGPPNPARDPSSTVSPQAPGESGIAWYSTWEVAQKEAIRSNRPIFFMAAASQCGGVPGVF